MRKFAAVILTLSLLSLCGCRLGFQPAETAETANWDAAVFNGTTAPEEAEEPAETTAADPLEKYKNHYTETMGDISASSYVSPAEKLNFRMDFEGVRRSKLSGQNETFYASLVANADNFGDRIDEYVGWMDKMGFCPLCTVDGGTASLALSYIKDAEEGDDSRGGMGNNQAPETFDEFKELRKNIAKEFIDVVGEDFVATDPEFVENKGDYDLMYCYYKATDTKQDISSYYITGVFKTVGGTVSFEAYAQEDKDLEKIEKWLGTLKKN